MSEFDHSELKGGDVSHLEKHESPEALSNEFVDVPAGYFPVTTEDKALSRALNVKLDLFLLPLLSLLYLFNGLDRGNVGNAQTQGQKHLMKGIRHRAHTHVSQGSPPILAQLQVTLTWLCHCSSSPLFYSSLSQLQWADA